MCMKMKLLLLILYIICVDFVKSDSPWHSYKFNSGYDNRYDLVIVDAVSDETFEVGEGVYKWRNIRIGKRNFAVGLMPFNVTVLVTEASKDGKRFVTNSSVYDFEASPTDLELFQNWNPDLRKLEVICVIATDRIAENLQWFKISEEATLEKVSSWDLHQKATHLNVFERDHKRKMLIISGNSTKASADIYEFEFRNNLKDFLHVQKLPLANPTNSSTFTNVGPHSFLAIPQKSTDMVFVYKFLDNRYVSFKNITCTEPDNVISFKTGFKSYLAVAGLDGGIFRFTKTTLIPENTELPLDGVHFWFQIPVSNFRNDVILLAQRSLEHDTHNSLSLEFFLQSEGRFATHEEVTCSFLGESTSGLRCVADEDRVNGVIGLAAISLGRTLGLLVPRESGPSAMLMLRVEMREVANPVDEQMKKLSEARKKLEKMMENQNVVIKRDQEDLKTMVETNVVGSGMKTDAASAAMTDQHMSTRENLDEYSELEEKLVEIKLKVAEMEETLDQYIENRNKPRHYKTVIFNNVAEITGDVSSDEVFSEYINGEDANVVIGDIVRRNEMKEIPSSKIFTNLKVEELEAKTINGISSDEFIFEGQDVVTIKGDLIFQEPVEVRNDMTISTGKVNDLLLEEEIVDAEKIHRTTMNFEKIRVTGTVNVEEVNQLDGFTSDGHVPKLEIDSLVVPMNVSVENVNGINFDSFLHSLCLRNAKSYIQGDLSILGTLTVAGNADTNFLNGLKFPEEYVFGTSHDFYTIKGHKDFLGSLEAGEVTVHGLINGIDADTLITLSQNQTIPDILVFSDLEIAENFDYKGKIIGSHAEDYLPNPTLMETNTLSCNVNFQELEVGGIVTIAENFNGSNFASNLDDIVYTDETNPTISAPKQFPNGFTVKDDLIVKSNTINNIPLDSFVTTNTQQVLNIKRLDGSVTFDNLALGGLFQGINVTKLDEETVKTFGDQYVAAVLDFVNEPSFPSLNITETLNDVPINEYLLTTGDRKFENDFEFGEVEAENVFVAGNVITAFEEVDLDDFDRRRLSLTRDQDVIANFSLGSSTTKWMRADFVNGLPFDYLFGTRAFAQRIANDLHAGKIKIKDLFINGSLQIDEINGHNMNSLMKHASWRGKMLEPGSELICRTDVTFDQLFVESFNKVNFNHFANTVVYKHETDVQFDGFKIYNAGMDVEKYIESDKINDVFVADILRKNGDQALSGPVNILGDVTVLCDTEVGGNLNGVPLDYIGNTFEVIDDGYKINGDVYFDRLTYIRELNVDGFANDAHLSTVLPSIVNKKADFHLMGETIFENEVEIKGNLAVSGKVNGVDLSELASSSIMITTDSEVEAPVMFKNHVVVKEALNVDGDLESRYVDGIDLQFWKHNATYINRGIIYGNFSFEDVEIDGDLNTNYLNDVAVKDLIPLKTEQQIPGNIVLGQVIVYNDIEVGNLVNGYKLKDLLDTTIMNGTDQEISSEITFANRVLIYDNLETMAPVNGVFLEKLVTTSSDQNLSAQYVFDGRTTTSDLFAHENVDGIDLNDWFTNAVKKNASHVQYIDSNLDVQGNMSFANDVEGDGLINNMSFPLMAKQLEEKKREKYALEKRLIDGYQNVCADVNFALKFAKKQIYAFKYLEEKQVLSFSSLVTNVHRFTNNEISYVLINEERNCLGHLFMWMGKEYRHLVSIPTGLVSQVISVKGLDVPYLVTHGPVGSTDCPFDGTNVWRLRGTSLERKYKLDGVVLLQESLAPRTFFIYGSEGLIEYKILESGLRKNRKWHLNDDNLAFIPRGLQTGLAMRNGRKIFRLTSDNTVNDDTYSHEMEYITVGSVEEIPNSYIPGFTGGEMVVMKVGLMDARRTMVAVTSHDETRVSGSFDLIKIYDDIMSGSLFQNLAAYRPSSPTYLDFETGESLLLFLEDEKTLQVYEYKGVEGFKHRSSADVEGQELFVVELPVSGYKNSRKIVGIINGNKVTLLESVMMGNRLEEDDLDCEL